MARITLQFTEEQIKVIRCLRFNKLVIKHERQEIINRIKEVGSFVDGIDPGEEESQNDAGKEAVHELCNMIHDGLNDIYKSAARSRELAIEDSEKYCGFDMYDLFNGIHPYKVVAFILGEQDKAIEGSEEMYGFPKYPDELVQKFDEILGYIYARIIDIEDLIHQRCNLGGIEPDVKYIALDHERIWRTEDEFKEAKKKKKSKDSE